MNLSQIRGFGPAIINKLRDEGIETAFDLISHFPARYIDLSKAGRFDECGEGEEFAALGILTSATQKHLRKGLSFVRGEFLTPEDVKFTATWFNQAYVLGMLKEGNQYFVFGKLKKQKSGYEISAPTLKTVTTIRPIMPVYRSMGISKAMFERAVGDILKGSAVTGIVPAPLRRKYGLMDTKQAFVKTHFPATLSEANEARRSLATESLASHILYFMASKGKNIPAKPFSYNAEAGVKAVDGIISSLGFELTDDQHKALRRIRELMDAPAPMNALLEGDVGCGKTIVCFLAMQYAAASGHQSVLMAPTELLARQHYQKAAALFGYENVEFLYGSQNASARSLSKFNIKNGVAKIIVGTHSVFTKDIVYKDLTLVITDEQHRFGVGQRGNLENKTDAPDTVVMSATPIPRTLALTVYGDLELISIHTKPKAKARIFTRFVGSKVKEMYDYILKKAQSGEQTYIVCPRIDSDDELTNATDLYEQLKKGPLGEHIALLHGRMKDEQKAAVMDSFVKGEKKVLVSTTIIEVGIDVRTATTMVIYNAERYGMSQLHQLRGRIGRGTIDSYCFLLCDPAAYETRLKFLEECDDGFLLAEKDFDIRGAGDFLGFKQHGKSVAFAGVPITADLLNKAKSLALELNATESIRLSVKTQSYFKGMTLN